MKELEHQGYHFEAGEASFELLLRRALGLVPTYFTLESFRLTVAQGGPDGSPVADAEATIRLRVGAERIHTAATGNGPVNALDHALRKALLPFYPAIGTFRLVDYKVRVLDGQAGTGARVRVLIETRGRTGPLGDGGGLHQHHRGQLAGPGGQHGVRPDETGDPGPGQRGGLDRIGRATGAALPGRKAGEPGRGREPALGRLSLFGPGRRSFFFLGGCFAPRRAHTPKPRPHRLPSGKGSSPNGAKAGAGALGG